MSAGSSGYRRPPPLSSHGLLSELMSDSELVERKSCLFLLLRTLISLDRGATLMTSFNLIPISGFPGDSNGKRICLQCRRPVVPALSSLSS